MQVINLLLFFLLVFIVFYLPGRFFLRLFGYKFNAFVITVSTSIVVGISLFLLVTYLLAFIKFDYIYNLFLVVILFKESKKSIIELKDQIAKKNFLLEYLIIFLGAILMSYLTFRSGALENGNLIFYGVNGVDSIFNIALIRSLVISFPPIHPGLSGVPLRGYHIFYDFLVAEFLKFYRINIFDLFFRDFSIFISILYGISSLALARFLKWDRVKSTFFIILMYFVQSFDFYANYIFRAFHYYYNSAGIVQSLSNMLDPTVIISISLVFTAYILLFSRAGKWSFIMPALVIGLLPEVKIYTSIIFYFGFGAVVLWEAYKYKNYEFLKTFVLSGLISAVVYLPVNYGAGSLVFAPLLIYKNFIDSAWIFNNWHWNVNFPIYEEAHNYLHIAFFYFAAIFIFLFTSLGIRVVIFSDFKKVFKKNFYTSQNWFWASSILVAFIIPSFFVQSSSTFQNIQFLWIGYIILLVPTAFVLGNWALKSKKVYFLLLLTLIILFTPSLFNEIFSYSENPVIVGRGITEKTDLISKLPISAGVIVINRVLIKGKYEDAYKSPLIAGLSGHPIYYEEEVAQFQGLGKIVGERKLIIDKIEENMLNCTNSKEAEKNIINLMIESRNQYIFLLKKSRCFTNFKIIKLVNGSGDSALYKI